MSAVDTRYVEFTKVDDEKRNVFGWAYVAKDADGTVMEDTQGDFIDTDNELETPAYEFVKSSRRGFTMHFKKDIGTLIESIVFTREKMEKMGIPPGVLPELAWWAGFHVIDDETWDMVKKGKLKGFSMGGSGLREKVGA